MTIEMMINKHRTDTGIPQKLYSCNSMYSHYNIHMVQFVTTSNDLQIYSLYDT